MEDFGPIRPSLPVLTRHWGCDTAFRMTIRLHRGDLPDLSRYTGAVAIDTETMGLSLGRDRLCLVQLSPGDGSADVVQIAPHATDAPNLKRLLADAALLRYFTSGGSILPCSATLLA